MKAWLRRLRAWWWQPLWVIEYEVRRYDAHIDGSGRTDG